jgi:hypothetical protein
MILSSKIRELPFYAEHCCACAIVDDPSQQGGRPHQAKPRLTDGALTNLDGPYYSRKGEPQHLRKAHSVLNQFGDAYDNERGR